MSLKQLRDLANQETTIDNMYLKDKLEKLGLEEDLKRMYSPLIESNKSIIKGAKKNTEKIVNKIGESENRLGEIKQIISNFPNVIATLKGKEVDLSPTDVSLIESLSELPTQEVEKIVKELDEDLPPPPEEFPTNEQIEAEKKEVRERRKEVIEMLKAFSSHDKDKIDEIINNGDKIDLLVKNAIHSDVTNFNKSKTYKEIDKYLNDFENVIKEERAKRGITDATIKAEKERKIMKIPKTGTGLIRYLPSSTNDLVSQMNRLLGSYKAGNKNAFNEISAISDVLRRRGLLTPQMTKQLYKRLN